MSTNTQMISYISLIINYNQLIYVDISETRLHLEDTKERDTSHWGLQLEMCALL